VIVTDLVPHGPWWLAIHALWYSGRPRGQFAARLPPDVRVSGGPGLPSPHRHLSLV